MKKAIYLPRWGSNQSLEGWISSLRLKKSSETRTKRNDHDTDSSCALMLWVFPGAGRGPRHRFSSYCLSFKGPKEQTNLGLKKFENISGGLWSPSTGIRLWSSPLSCGPFPSPGFPWFGSGTGCPEPAAQSDIGQTGVWDLWMCHSKRELEREELIGNQWTGKKTMKLGIGRKFTLEFLFLRNSNLHLVLRRWCRCLFVSLSAVAALGSTACSGICHLNPDLHTLAKQRKTALVSVIYICVLLRFWGFFSSWSRSSCLVLYYKGVIKPNEMESQCPTTGEHSHSFPHQSQGGYHSCQLSPSHPDLLLFWGQTVLGEPFSQL